MEQNSAGLPEKNPADLSGMSAIAAKEYIFGFISTLKLTEKQAGELDAELSKWNSRIELAKSKGHPELAQAAEQEVMRIKNRRQGLALEISGLESSIETMRRQLPLLAAKERSIDPDLLEQELLIASGYLPGEEAKARSNRSLDALEEMEKEAAAEAALSELKAKMKEEH
jgi:chromosome segregation ATPase